MQDLLHNLNIDIGKTFGVSQSDVLKGALPEAVKPQISEYLLHMEDIKMRFLKSTRDELFLDTVLILHGIMRQPDNQQNVSIGITKLLDISVNLSGGPLLGVIISSEMVKSAGGAELIIKSKVKNNMFNTAKNMLKNAVIGTDINTGIDLVQMLYSSPEYDGVLSYIYTSREQHLKQEASTVFKSLDKNDVKYQIRAQKIKDIITEIGSIGNIPREKYHLILEEIKRV